MSRSVDRMRQLLDSFQDRVPWDTAQKILVELGVPRGHGWEKTRAKLERELLGDDDMQAQLRDALVEHILNGEKTISFHDASNEAMSRLYKFVTQTEAEKSPYPFLLSQSQLEHAPLSKPKFVGYEQLDDGVAGVFSSVRLAEVREPIEREAFPEDERGLFDRYSEVLGVRRTKSQAFDILWLPHAGRRIELRIDSPRGVPHDASIVARKQLIKQLEEEAEIAFPNPINLFPLIRKIYDDPDEGQIVELAFHTTTASLKYERMRRRRSCLREELYHKAGRKALDGKISAYRLSVQWLRDHGAKNTVRPELSLNSTIHMLHEAHPFLGDAILRRCTGADDYEFVRSRIIHHLA